MEHTTDRFQHSIAGSANTGALRKFYKLYSIDKDLEAKRLERLKASGTGRVIGGRSLWGGLFDVLLERYHWTFEYLIWGISYTNVQMLLSDSVQVFYGDKANESSTVISADNPKNMSYIMNLVND